MPSYSGLLVNPTCNTNLQIFNVQLLKLSSTDARPDMNHKIRTYALASNIREPPNHEKVRSEPQFTHLGSEPSKHLIKKRSKLAIFAAKQKVTHFTMMPFGTSLASFFSSTQRFISFSSSTTAWRRVLSGARRSASQSSFALSASSGSDLVSSLKTQSNSSWKRPVKLNPIDNTQYYSFVAPTRSVSKSESSRPY